MTSPISSATKRATIITDASVSVRYGVGGWAAWVKTDLHPAASTFSGIFGIPTASSHKSELMAISNGIAAAIKHDLLDEIDLVMIQSDNIGALALIAQHIPRVIINDAPSGGQPILISTTRTPRPLRRPEPGAPFRNDHITAAVIDRITEFVETYDIDLEVRHVKGHAQNKPGSTGRNIVNAWCDKEARRQRIVAERQTMKRKKK